MKEKVKEKRKKKISWEKKDEKNDNYIEGKEEEIRNDEKTERVSRMKTKTWRNSEEEEQKCKV